MSSWFCVETVALIKKTCRCAFLSAVSLFAFAASASFFLVVSTIHLSGGVVQQNLVV